MTKFRTITTDSSTHRIFDGQLRVCASDNKKNYKVKLMLLNEKVNRNKWRYTRISEHTDEAQDIPLLYSVINGKVGNSHDFDVVTDEKGNKYASFIGAESEHPYGWLPSIVDGEKNARMENIDGVDWLTATAYLPSHYNVEMIKELERNGNQMPISIETLVSKNHYEGDVEVEDEYSIIGVTILGITTTPAVANANIRKLSANGQAFQELKMRCASLADEFNMSRNSTKNQNSKKGVTRTMAKVRKIDDLHSLFPNHTVLGVNGQSVALLNEKGRCCSYTFQENENTVVPERIEEIAVNSVFGEGENAINISAEELVGSVQAQLNSTKTALDKATEENGKLQAKINAMTEAEYLRRKKVVERAIRETFDDNRRQYGGDIDANFVDDLLTDECLSNYARMEDKDGFCGENAARTEVDARCMRKLREVNKARQNTAKPKYAWELGGEGYEDKPESGINTAIDNILKD